MCAFGFIVCVLKETMAKVSNSSSPQPTRFGLLDLRPKPRRFRDSKRFATCPTTEQKAIVKPEAFLPKVSSACVAGNFNGLILIRLPARSTAIFSRLRRKAKKLLLACHANGILSRHRSLSPVASVFGAEGCSYSLRPTYSTSLPTKQGASCAN